MSCGGSGGKDRLNAMERMKMSKWTSRQRILLGCAAMALAIIGDYLLGYGTIEQTSDPGAYLGIAWNVAPDWRYALSSVLGFICAALFAVAAVALIPAMKKLPKTE